VPDLAAHLAFFSADFTPTLAGFLGAHIRKLS
jgi:hypothetical protein